VPSFVAGGTDDMLIQSFATKIPPEDAALLPVRAALGSSMVFHGIGKLKAAEETGQIFHGVGIRPGKPWALATGVVEVFAGVGAILGIWTRPAALAVLATQAVAMWKVHLSKGYDLTKGGYEYNLALMAIATALLVAGPGKISAHEGLEHLLEGRGPKRILKRVRPSPLLRLLKIIK
jgi:putative oxidoreductase